MCVIDIYIDIERDGAKNEMDIIEVVVGHQFRRRPCPSPPHQSTMQVKEARQGTSSVLYQGHSTLYKGIQIIMPVFMYLI